jgi:quercetin dioxygenase-like cupin family protein
MERSFSRSLRPTPWVPLLLALAAPAPAWSQQAAAADDTKIVPLMNQVLGDIRGKEGTMLTVEYAPGASSPRHRHNAHVFVYVLEGSIVMQADGKPPVTLKPGDTFYENPKDIHAVSKNASATQPAKFVVFMVKNKGAPPVLPAK